MQVSVKERDNHLTIIDNREVSRDSSANFTLIARNLAEPDGNSVTIQLSTDVMKDIQAYMNTALKQR